MTALAAAGSASARPVAQETLAEITVVAAGDIASCESAGAADTAALLESLRPNAVLTLGDNAYPDGTPADFANCYEPSWGAFRNKTFPAPGNHDYHTRGAAGYFGYFGSRAPARYYSFNLGAWHLVSLNSEVNHASGSPQLTWLRRDLRADPRRCEVLYWHRPRWSGGAHGSDPGMWTFWRAAYDLGVDLVLVGHDHNYQRFYRLNPRGEVDRRYGVLQLVVGTGGKSLYDAGSGVRNRAVANSTTNGVLELTLRSGGYDLRFVPVAGSTWTDVVAGRSCHGAPPR